MCHLKDKRLWTVAGNTHVLYDVMSSENNIAGSVGVFQSSVCRQQFHLYHLQAMGPADLAPCADYDHCVEIPDFPRIILFTEEAHFTNEGLLNCPNSHSTDPHGFQHNFDINVWTGIIHGHNYIFKQSHGGPIRWPPYDRPINTWTFSCRTTFMRPCRVTGLFFPCNDCSGGYSGQFKTFGPCECEHCSQV